MSTTSNQQRLKRNHSTATSELVRPRKRSSRSSSPCDLITTTPKRPKPTRPTSLTTYYPRSEGEASIDRLEDFVKDDRQTTSEFGECGGGMNAESDWSRKETLRFCGADVYGEIAIPLRGIEYYPQQFIIRSTEEEPLRANFCPKRSCFQWSFFYDEGRRHSLTIPLSSITSLSINPLTASLDITLSTSPSPLPTYSLTLCDPAHVCGILTVLTADFPDLHALFRVSAPPPAFPPPPLNDYVNDYDYNSENTYIFEPFATVPVLLNMNSYDNYPLDHHKHHHHHHQHHYIPPSPPYPDHDYSVSSGAATFTPPSTPGFVGYHEAQKWGGKGYLPSPEWVGDRQRAVEVEEWEEAR